MRIVVIGGAGFIGSKLVDVLLRDGHEVVVFDSCWFSTAIERPKQASFVQGDLRTTDYSWLQGADLVVHLANIANDPAVELDPMLSWEVNVLASMGLAEAMKLNNIRPLIFASSGSVYGIQNVEHVVESTPLVPLSVYNKTKMIAERVFRSYEPELCLKIIRPATVCGVSRNMRWDVSVNMFVRQAMTVGKITVFGGEQVRPNIHIEDLVKLIVFLGIDHPKLSGVFNAGFENLSILTIAQMVSDETGAELEVLNNQSDPRSYRINSDKILGLGFKPDRCVQDAIMQIIGASSDNGLDIGIDGYRVEKMKRLIELGVI